MRQASRVFVAVAFCLSACLTGCQRGAERGPLRFRITLSKEVAQQVTAGRLLVFLSGATQESHSLAVGFLPDGTWMAAMEVADFAPGQTIEFNPDLQAYPQPLSQAKPGAYQVMALFDLDHSFAYGGQNEGDLCSAVVKLPNLTPANNDAVTLVLNRRTERAVAVAETESLKLAELQSPLLTAFWQRPVTMRAAVVLPPSYHRSSQRAYPALYRIHGFGGAHTEAWQEGDELQQAMRAGKASEMLHIFLDASSPTGHHLYADSANNGPWARALIEEFIPHLEQRFRLIARPEARFLTGHSSGGWSSLWLQITYPDFFGGTWSTAPDPVDFRSFLGLDLTPGAHDNAYRTREGKPRNLARSAGKEILSLEEFAKQEEVKGQQGGQLASFEWVWSPRGADGRPLRLFDRATGELNPAVQQAWQQYDIHLILEKNWADLEAKLRGKIHVLVGSEDNYHLEAPVLRLCEFLQEKKSAAVCEIVPGRDHDNLYQPHPSYPDGLATRINQEIQAKFAVGAKATR
jgi:S-formylglutathione hydrolase FrmB